LLQWNESLVDKMKAGDQPALEQCYRQLSPVIYTAIFNISRDQGNANYLLQDTFIAAFEKIHSYTATDKSFIAWLKCIAFNKTCNFLTKH
jgi:DNA-directed RNA polymerase specialized sigma24 family protein